MQKPTVLAVAVEQSSHSALRTALKGVATLQIAETDAGAAVSQYTENTPQLVIVSLSREPQAQLAAVADLVAAGARVVVIGPAKDPDLILGAMRAGAREFLLESDVEGLRRAVQELGRTAESQAAGGTVITIFATRGGVGATALATNLGHALQRAGRRVCLVDLDLHLGDVLSFLDLPGTYSISDVLSNMGRLDRELLDASIARHASGLRVLAQSGKVEEADHVRPIDAAQLLAFLRQHYECVLVDGVRGFDEMALAALDSSQKILMVLTQDVPAVRNAKRCLDLFRRLGYSEGKLSLVLNRYQKDPEITPEVIEEMTGLAVSHTLNNDFAAVIESINRGVPLHEVAPRSRLTKDIEQMVSAMVDRCRSGARAGFFRNLLSGRTENGTAGAS